MRCALALPAGRLTLCCNLREQWGRLGICVDAFKGLSKAKGHAPVPFAGRLTLCCNLREPWGNFGGCAWTPFDAQACSLRCLPHAVLRAAGARVCVFCVWMPSVERQTKKGLHLPVPFACCLTLCCCLQGQVRTHKHFLGHQRKAAARTEGCQAARGPTLITRYHSVLCARRTLGTHHEHGFQQQVQQRQLGTSICWRLQMAPTHTATLRAAAPATACGKDSTGGGRSSSLIFPPPCTLHAP